MNSIAVKQKRHQEKKAQQREQAKRKAKVYKGQALARRRQMDRARRARQRRERQEHTQRRQRVFRFRVKVVRYFHQLRQQGVSEKRTGEVVPASVTPAGSSSVMTSPDVAMEPELVMRRVYINAAAAVPA